MTENIKDTLKRTAGVICNHTQNTTYLYVSGLEISRSIRLSEGVTLEPVKCNPEPDDMIDCIMKQGSQLEYDLEILISSLRSTTAQIRIEGRTGKELAVKAWNAQSDIVTLSAILKCFAVAFFQSDTSASEFGSSSSINILNRSVFCMPNEVKQISVEEQDYLEKDFPTLSSLDYDNRFQTAVSALWASHMNPRPAIKAMILWGGIESLFLIDKNIKNVLSRKIALFLNEAPIEEQVKVMYKQRSKSVHELTNQDKQFVRDSEDLLHRLIRRCIDLHTMPPLDKSQF